EASLKGRSNSGPNPKSASASEEVSPAGNAVLGRESLLWLRPEREAKIRLGTTMPLGAGIGGEVLRPEESRRCARAAASPRFSTQGRLWPGRGEFGSAGSRQSNFAKCGTRILDSTRSHGPNIRGEWNRSAAPHRDFAKGIAAQ